MKKLMLIAAVAGSAVAFGADVEGFVAGDGVYNVTFSEKAFAIGGTVSGETIQETGDTKAEALQAANEAFDLIKEDSETYPNAKKTSTKTIYSADDEQYVCTIKWTYTSEEEVTEKLVTKSYAGILIKGNYSDSVQDGTFMVWSKSKDGKYWGEELRKLGNYEAYPLDAAVFTGSQKGKKAVGCISLDGDSYNGIGFGTSNDDGVKALSGSITFCEDELEQSGYGTWKIQKDATATKMAEAGYPLERLLNKKGATEYID